MSRNFYVKHTYKSDKVNNKLLRVQEWQLIQTPKNIGAICR